MKRHHKRYVPSPLALANTVEWLRARSPEALWRILYCWEILPALEQALGPVPPVGDEIVDLAIAPAAQLVEYRHAPRGVGLELRVEPVDDDLLLVDALARRELIPRQKESGEAIDHWRSSRQLDILPEADHADKLCVSSKGARGWRAVCGGIAHPGPGRVESPRMPGVRTRTICPRSRC